MNLHSVRAIFFVVAFFDYLCGKFARFADRNKTCVQSGSQAGRPNDSDLALATEFGKKIIEKIKTATGPDTLYPIDVRAIKRPRQPFFPLFRFLRKVIKLRKSGTPLPRTPWVKDESLCTHCGLCVVHCPAGAITKGDELNVDETKCIKCCACVKVCPRNAKVYDTPFAALLSDCFKKQKQPQTIL